MENHISALRIIRQILRRDQKIARLRPDGHAVFIFRTEQRPPRRRRWTPGDGKAVFLHPAASDEKLARLVQEWMDRACTSYSGITSKRF